VFRGKAVVIACTDKDRSVRFYRDLLGAESVPGHDDGYGCPWLRLGALTITLNPSASRPAVGKFPEDAGMMLWLEVDDLGAARDHLAAHGVPVENYHEGECLYITDPDGLLVEVWQAHPEA
jgi:catechol 2,3-dioxygenase-like lactoylglutathione lyase family enzyme